MLVFWEPIIWTNFTALNFIQMDTIAYFTQNFKLLFLGYSIFLIGLLGLLLHSVSVLYILISIEMIFLGINIVLIAIGNINLIIQIPVYVLIILTLAAAETAVVLSLTFLYHRLSRTTDLHIANFLRF